MDLSNSQSRVYNVPSEVTKLSKLDYLGKVSTVSEQEGEDIGVAFSFFFCSWEMEESNCG